MEIVRTKLGASIDLGRQGEKMARKIVFDVGPWIEMYGNGVVQLLHQRKNDLNPYPVALQQSENEVYWFVSEVDTAEEGMGRYELHFYAGNSLVKSATGDTFVLKAMNSNTEPPDQYQTWIDQMLETGTRAEEAAIKAEESGERAVSAVADAEKYSNRAKAEASRATVAAEQAFAASKSSVKTVNGKAPDENGNVIIETGGSGEGSMMPFIVTAWENHVDSIEYGADKTSEEIYQAWKNNQVIVCKYDSDGFLIYELQPVMLTPDTVVFSNSAITPRDNQYTSVVIQGSQVSRFDSKLATEEFVREQIAASGGSGGTDGFSPIANVAQTSTGAVITITDKTGTTTATVINGVNGQDGKDGADGKPGEKGDKGDPGEPGATGPAGPQGPQGEQGVQGEQGPKGDTGPAGADGAKGDKGDKGDTGPVGPQGPEGPKGADGTGVTILGSYASAEELAAQHPTGTPGDSYLVGGHLYVWSATKNEWEDVGNIQGPQGPKGDTGDTGPEGPQGQPGKDGQNGKDGTSVTHSWNGTTLTIVSASGTSSADLKGDQGEPGQPGEKGEKGDQGIQGIQGIQGEPGAKGDKGDQGEPGKDGADGAPGKDGQNGKDGVSVTHSWNGTTLTVASASGTSSANLKGEKGDKGDTGAQGIQGIQGIQGEPGAKGDKGDQGVQGIQGIPGEKGDKGDTGAAGTNGTNGVSVSSVKQTTTSSADGGSNVVTVTLSNGTTSTFTVKNGSKGSAGTNGTNGTNGKDGKTPVKGVDYWTTADQEAIVQDVIAALGTPVFGRVDADNNIILTGELADGAYTVKYEDGDGTITTIGNLTQGVTYTNVLALATDESGAVLNGVGYKDGYRFGLYSGDLDQDTSGTTGFFATGFIPYTASQCRQKLPFYIKGISLDLAALPDYLRFTQCIPGSTDYFGICKLATETTINNFTITKLGDNYYKFTPNANLNTLQSWYSKGVTHARFTLPGSGAGVIITIDEPIE